MDEQPTTPDGAPYVPEQPPIFPVQQAAPVAQPAPIAQAAPVTQPAPIAQTMPQAPVSTAPQYPTGSAYAWSAAPAASAFTQPSAPAPVATSAPRAKRHWPAVVTASVLAAVLASGGTALAIGALDQQTSNSAYSGLGTTTPVASSTVTDVDWQSIAAQVRDSVVAIAVTTSAGSGAGSGVVIDAEKGYVVTNNHVVGDATTGGITVQLADGRLFEAKIVGTDPTTDVAVIQLTDPPSDLKASTFGDSEAVLVGQDVMAVGNPLGLASTVTTGIISAVDRPVSTSGDTSTTAVVTNAIQIDAAINPGNSGGPLFNTQGEVIGINSSIATTSSESGSIGLGFAIPSNQVEQVANQLIADGVAEHAYLGVTLSEGTATADGVTRKGAKVESVSSDTPAAEAGLKVGDVIVGINGKVVAGAESLTGFVRQYASGDEVTLTVVRGGEAIDVNVTLAVRPADPDTSSGSGSGSGSPEGNSSQAPDQGQQGQGNPQLPGLPWGGVPDNG